MTAHRDPLAAEAVAIAADPAIEAVLEEVCQVTGMGFAAVARVTEHRWVACQVLDKLEFGLNPGDELELKTTICDEIRESGTAVIIDEVRADEDWRTHPVPMLYGFESYVSLPLFLKDGSFFGTLCAIDPEPRSLSAPETVAALQRLAERVVGILSARRAQLPRQSDSPTPLG